MGEARSKRRAHAAALIAYPWCIYCGDPATTVEHMPPRMMFLGKQRPKGLEFPTCAECNNGTSHADLVASLLGRTFPEPPSEQGQNDLAKLLRAVSNNVPGLLQEMYVGTGGQKIARRNIPKMPAGTGVLRADGPLVSGHMTVFAAKLGYALHFQAFGKPVPSGGGVQPLWVSNAQAARDELPTSVIELLPPAQTLRQGKKEVSDQFEYSWLATEDRRHSVFSGVFRSSFAVFAISALDRSEFLEKNADRFPIISPGDLRRR
jgi:hypothetical protein